jgi:Flp pilus assembly protein TadG
MKIAVQHITRLLHSEEGSELVEFAVSIMLLLTMMFGIMDFCRMAYTYHFTTYAAQEGARFAIVRGYHWSGAGACNTSAPPNFTLTYGCEAKQADVQNYVKSIALPLIDTSQLSVVASWPATTPDCTSSCSACTHKDQQGCMVNVTVGYTFSFMMPFLPKSSALTFSGTSSKVIQE